MKKYDVFGIGNALMDIQTFIPEKELKNLKIAKGVMSLIDEKKSREILSKISNFKTISLPGGSCANTVSIIALLGGKPAYTGIVVDDFYGRLFEAKLVERGVKSLITMKTDGLTGSCIVLTTEDAERSMNTYLGVCRDLEKEDVNTDILASSSIFHCTGYQWDTDTQKSTIEYTMKSAKKLELKVSFDVADPFCIQRNVEEFKRIIGEYVDILFANKEEAKILTGKEDPVEAGKEIQKMGAKIAVVKVGCDGSYLFTNDEVIKVDIFTPEKVLDSTGCGDIYAGGFLYAYSNGYDLTKCAKIASYLAAQIISVPGVQLESLDLKRIKLFIQGNF